MYGNALLAGKNLEQERDALRAECEKLKAEIVSAEKRGEQRGWNAALEEAMKRIDRHRLNKYGRLEGAALINAIGFCAALKRPETGEKA